MEENEKSIPTRTLQCRLKPYGPSAQIPKPGFGCKEDVDSESDDLCHFGHSEHRALLASARAPLQGAAELLLTGQGGI